MRDITFARCDANGVPVFNPGQWGLLQSEEPYVLLAGGVGSGKTSALCAKLLQLRVANWGLPGLLVAPTAPMLKAVTLRELLHVYRATRPDMPRPEIKDWMGERYLDFHDDGAKLFLRTATKPEGIEGFSVAYACGDEARWWPHVAYNNLIARVRLKAPRPQVVLSSTPSLGWMSEEFNENKPNRKLIVAPTRENLRNLRPDYLEDLKVSYSPRVQRAILEGEFIPMEGVVFDAFDGRPDSDWIIPDNWQPTREHMKHCKIYLAVDPGYRRSAWLFIIEIRPMDWIVFDQLILDNTTDISAVEIVNNRKYPIDEIWVDPAAESVQSATGSSTRRIMQRIETRDPDKRVVRILSQRYRDIAFGIDKLRVLLGGYEGYPQRIRFTSHVLGQEKGKPRGIVKDLSCLQYGELKEGRAVSDQPIKDGLHDHFCDALRYFSVGMYLSIPALYNKDPTILKDGKAGFRIAA